MTDERKLELSRRKVLGGLGTIGLASAGAGLGTSAYFSDEETFKNNTLTAGELDLKVDWEEHYVDWLNDNLTSEADVDGVRMEMDPANIGDDEIGIPDAENPLLAVKTVDTDDDDIPQIDEFMDASSIEAYPDSNDDGVQDDLEQYDACVDLADTPEDLDPRGGLRTNNEDTIGIVDEGEEVYPLVNLHDVKPGDFGELTLSFHLCDNPGYIWLNGQLVSESENGLTEPEAKDSDEGPGVELTDEIQTMLWYDEDGDNVYEPGGEADAADIALVLDESGSMSGGALSDAKDAAKNLIDAVGDNAQVSVVGFDSNVTMYQQLTTNKGAAKTAVDQLAAGGSTNIEEAIDIAHEEVDGHDVHPTYDASGNDRDGAESIIVLLTDGSPNVDVGYDDDSTTTPFESEFGEADPSDNADFAKDVDPHVNTIYTVGFGGVSSGSDEADLLEYMASDPDKAFIGAQSELFEIFSNIAQQIAGEEAFFRGSLRELLEELSTGNGIPLDGDRTSSFDELQGDPTAPERDCFVESTTNAVGLAWWLPVDHGNEVQSDSVTFDLGFYTEQCRHNDGGGMESPIPTREGSGFAKISENFNGDESTSAGARARYGDGGGSTQTWELGVGDEPGTSGEFAQEQYDWMSGQTVDWSVSYDESTDEMTFMFDGTTVTDTIDDPQPDGRIAVQAKAADGATVEISNVSTDLGPLSGPNDVSASGNGGRQINYIVLNTDLDGATSFSVSGQATVTIDSATYGGSEEGANVDVVFE